MINSKAQSATEFMILITALLIIFIPILFIIVDYGAKSVKEVDIQKIHEVGENIVVQARDIYYLGVGSKEIMTITVPRGIETLGTMAIWDTVSGKKEYYLMVKYLKEEDVLDMNIQSEVLLTIPGCVMNYANSNCPTVTPAGIECFVCTFSNDVFSVGRKDLQLETIKQTSPDLIKVEITPKMS